MSELRKGYAELQDVVLDASFPELDLALRRGRHIDRQDFAWYTLLTEAQDHLETFYRRYGCELIHKADGYFYLLPTGDQLSRRQLGAGDMLVGQALALLYLDPSTIERGGKTTTEDVIAQLVVVLGSDALVRAFNPKRKRQDERVAQKLVRARVAEAVRHLAGLGFVDLGDENQLVLRPALLRFAEPVRGMSAPAEALAKLVAEGEVALVTEEAEGAEERGEEDDETDDSGVDAEADDGDGAPPAVKQGAGASDAVRLSPTVDDRREDATTTSREPEDDDDPAYVDEARAFEPGDAADPGATAAQRAVQGEPPPLDDDEDDLPYVDESRALEDDEDDPPYVDESRALEDDED